MVEKEGKAHVHYNTQNTKIHRRTSLLLRNDMFSVESTAKLLQLIFSFTLNPQKPRVAVAGNTTKKVATTVTKRTTKTMKNQLKSKIGAEKMSK